MTDKPPGNVLHIGAQRDGGEDRYAARQRSSEPARAQNREAAPFWSNARAAARGIGRIAARSNVAFLKPARVPDEEEQQGRPLDGRIPKVRKSSSRGVRAAFVLMVALPTLLVGAYYALVASDQYVSGFHFSVRSQAPIGPEGLENAAGSQSAMQALADNFVVVDFLKSREAIEELQKTIDVPAIFRRANADFYARLDDDATAEDLVRYWQHMVAAEFDLTRFIGSVEVRGFNREDSLALANGLMRASERLVNEISERAKRDAVSFAENEVQRAELRLKFARSALREFREKQNLVDPGEAAKANFELSAKLKSELSALNAQMSSVGSYLSKDAPSVKFLSDRIRATQEQIRKIEEQVGKGNADTEVIAGLLTLYEGLELDREFAEKMYAGALTALDQARARAALQQLYLATHIEPRLADGSEYPRRITFTLIAFVCFLLIWGIATMLYYAITDRTS